MILTDNILSPWGRTSREHYWIALMFLACSVSAGWAMGSAVGSVPLRLLFVLLGIVYTVVTVRRLHDAGFSRWWAALYLFPASITWDLFQVQVGTSTWEFVDLSTVIKFIPMLIGVIGKAQDPTPEAVAHIFR